MDAPLGHGVFRALFTAYPDALIVADDAGRIVLANQAAAALLGYAEEELLGLGIDALVPDAVRPLHARYREGYAHSPRARPMGTQVELVARRRDGSEVMVEIALSPLRSDDGRALVVAAIRGIGDYPRVRQALQRARYSEYLAQIGRLAVDSRDPKGLIEQVPAIAAEALRLEVATVFLLEPGRLAFRVAGGVADGVVGDVARAGTEAIGSLVGNQPDTFAGFVLATGGPVRVTDFATEPRFTVPLATRAAGLTSALAVPLSDRGRAIGVLMVRSREAKAFAEDEVRFLESLSNLLATSLQRAQSEEALNHAQRLEAVGQLTGGIAHDFNNLLTIIQGNLQVIEELPALGSDAYGQQLVGAASRATRRGAELTRQLLAFSRRQVLQPSAIDAGQLLQGLADMLRRTLDQRIAIEVDVPAPGPGGALALQADAGQLESALLNSAINARDAMPHGGTLRFAARACSTLPADATDATDAPDVQDLTEGRPVAAGGFVALSIADTGTGMPATVRERAFEPFFTTKEAGRGTGLGLSTVYGFARQSQGAVALHSIEGVGTTLTIFLPRAAAPALQAVGGAVSGPAGDAEGADPHAAVPAGLRVLLVEDDPEVRRVVRRDLQALGCRTLEAASAEEALELLARGDPIDLLMSDIALGTGLRGTQLAAQAQAQRPALAVLLMSGFSAELLEADRDAPPDWELLHKPYSRIDLARAIARRFAP